MSFHEPSPDYQMLRNRKTFFKHMVLPCSQRWYASFYLLFVIKKWLLVMRTTVKTQFIGCFSQFRWRQSHIIFAVIHLLIYHAEILENRAFFNLITCVLHGWVHFIHYFRKEYC